MAIVAGENSISISTYRLADIAFRITARSECFVVKMFCWSIIPTPEDLEVVAHKLPFTSLYILAEPTSSLISKGVVPLRADREQNRVR